jgi:5-methylcytosine-specific restriction protein A
MNSFLFAWNPKKWPWDDLAKDVKTCRKYGRLKETWNCAGHKLIQPGDRAFLVRVGADPKGIMGSGYITSLPFLAPHWKNEDKMAYRVNIEFDILFDTEHEDILTLDKLKFKTKTKQVWTPQSSGIVIKREVVGKLERMWEEFVNRPSLA